MARPSTQWWHCTECGAEFPYLSMADLRREKHLHTQTCGKPYPWPPEDE